MSNIVQNQSNEKLFNTIYNVFADRSMYMQQQTGTFSEDFSKNVVCRFLNSAKINWLYVTTLLSMG